MNRAAKHTALVQKILLALSAKPDLLLAKNANGVASYVSQDGRRFRVAYGWPSAGGPDLLGVLAPTGRLFALEVKTGKARATANQRACILALERQGAFVRVVRSVEAARAALATARSGAS